MSIIGTALQLILLVFIVVLLYEFLTKFGGTDTSFSLGNFNLTNFSITNLERIFTAFNISQPLNYTPFSPPQNFVPQNQVIAYALSLINNDRNTFGLPNVTYSNETSGQQHSDSMLQYDYFSHWDPFGLKPYMRYALLNGTQEVDENIAYTYDSRGINVLDTLKQMENNFMYNDSVCCNNGHRINILTPQHNEVSIGIAYNRTTVYFTEDFINDYINWVQGTPNYNAGTVNLKGAALTGYHLSSVQVTYDQPVMNMTHNQLSNTSSYGYGQTVAGIGYSQGSQIYYFPNVTTINATVYNIQGSNFDVSFNMGKLENNLGAGEYTVMIYLSNSTGSAQDYCYTDSQGIARCNNFLASTYTMFINGSGQQYTPQNI